jgi:hypothetical protein
MTSITPVPNQKSTFKELTADKINDVSAATIGFLKEISSDVQGQFNNLTGSGSTVQTKIYNERNTTLSTSDWIGNGLNVQIFEIPFLPKSANSQIFVEWECSQKIFGQGDTELTSYLSRSRPNKNSIFYLTFQTKEHRFFNNGQRPSVAISPLSGVYDCDEIENHTIQLSVKTTAFTGDYLRCRILYFSIKVTEIQN